MITGAATDKLFSSTEIGLAILICVMSIAGSGYWSLQKYYYTLNSENIRVAEKVIDGFNTELGAVSGIMSSLTFMQQSFERETDEELGDLADKSINDSNVIFSIGRYQTSEPAHLQDLTDSLREKGLYKFEVFELDNQGERTLPGLRESYNPLIWLAPFSPALAKYIGVDLSSAADTSKAIDDANRNNGMALFKVPAGWSVDASVLAVSPTYLGRYTPDDPDARVAQSSGGFLIGLNFNSVINQLEQELPGITSKIELKNNLDSNQAVELVRSTSEQTSSRKLYLQSLFTGLRISSTPQLGQSSLLIDIKLPAGVPIEAFYRSILIMGGVLTCLLLIFSQVFRERIVGARLQLERQTALVTLTAIADAVVTTDDSGVVTYTNPSAEKLLKSNAHQMIGRLIHEVILLVHDGANNTAKTIRFSMLDAMAKQRSANLPELKVVNSSSVAVPVDSTLTTLGNIDQGSFRGFVLVMRDVSAERKLIRELEFQATHDSLTKLANRFEFERQLEALIESSNDGSCKHAICYIDLDQFKAVNDTCGHSAGDELLVRVTKGLLAQVRDSDILARLGGDEFGLLITNCEEAESENIAKKIHEFFQTFYFQFHENVFAIRASIGFVHINGRFHSIEDVMAEADLACYSAKDHGRNALHICSHENQETTDRKSELQLLPKVQKALQSNNFALYCQPIVSLTRQSEFGSLADHYEILLRLRDDDGKLITPVQMITAAERYNLMRDVDKWVISNSLQTIANLQRSLGKAIPVFSINLSGQSVVDPELPDFIANTISENGVSSERLNFEITETSAITNMGAALELVDTLHELGCTIALDDFGSGVSSFGYLKSLPVDYLKIDGQFVRNIHKNDVDLEMVKCMNAIAGVLGIQTVAEFVENGEIVDVLKRIGIDYAQGYHYSKPFPLYDLANALTHAQAA